MYARRALDRGADLVRFRTRLVCFVSGFVGVLLAFFFLCGMGVVGESITVGEGSDTLCCVPLPLLLPLLSLQLTQKLPSCE